MNSPIQNIYYFTENKHHLFNSLKRYFKYVLDIELVSYTDRIKEENIGAIFILNEEKDNNAFKNLFMYSTNNFITLGYDSKNSLINLLDLASLKEQLNKCILSVEENVFPLYTKEELLKKVEPLFKDHGEISLFEKLNYTQSYISNGIKLYLAKELEMEEVKHEFLLNAIKLWDNFRMRYQEYANYLKLLNCVSEVHLLNKYIMNFNEFICIIKRDIESNLIEIDELNLHKNLESLSKINEILKRIFINLGFVSAPVQITNNR